MSIMKTIIASAFLFSVNSMAIDLSTGESVTIDGVTVTCNAGDSGDGGGAGGGPGSSCYCEDRFNIGNYYLMKFTAEDGEEELEVFNSWNEEDNLRRCNIAANSDPRCFN